MPGGGKLPKVGTTFQQNCIDWFEMKIPRIAAVGECMLELQGPAFGLLRQHYGGDTFNAACYLARCGGGSVSFASALGDDGLSSALLERWAAEGLQLDLVRRLPGKRPGLYQIELDPQRRAPFPFLAQQQRGARLLRGPQHAAGSGRGRTRRVAVQRHQPGHPARGPGASACWRWPRG